MTAWFSPMAIAAAALIACTAASRAQTAAAPQDQSTPAAGAPTASDGLSDLDAMTFACARAGLNAAAREAGKVPSQGNYQFAYFRIVNNSHHSAYEVHFISNYEDEPELKYCVAIYCQQGWDPKATPVSVQLIGNTTGRPVAGAGHGTDCGSMQAPAKH
jgi:hypothetical protein